MTDYIWLRSAYACGSPDARLRLEEALCEVTGRCASDQELGRAVRRIAAAVEAGKAERMARLDKEVC